jgi:hypothetical protein
MAFATRFTPVSRVTGLVTGRLGWESVVPRLTGSITEGVGNRGVGSCERSVGFPTSVTDLHPR